MAKFVLLYTGGSMPASDSDRKQVMDAWGAWFGGLGDKVVDSGNPFGPHSKSVSNGGSIHEGAVGTPATGYTIISADSLDQAADLAKGCPVLQGGAKITVYEVTPVM